MTNVCHVLNEQILKNLSLAELSNILGEVTLVNPSNSQNQHQQSMVNKRQLILLILNNIRNRDTQSAAESVSDVKVDLENSASETLAKEAEDLPLPPFFSQECNRQDSGTGSILSEDLYGTPNWKRL